MKLDPELVGMARLALGLRADWPGTDRARWLEVADRHGVLPLCARRAREEGVSWVVEGAETAMARARAKLAVLGLEAEAAFAALQAASVRAASFKGFALGRRVYAQEGLRPMTDVDVLVGAADFGRAVEALEAAGFRRRVEPGRPATFDRADSWILTTPRGAHLDLHRAVARRRVFPVDHDAVLARSVPGRLSGERWLDDTDELHLACLHHQKHSFRVPLVQVVDVALLAWRAPDWERLVADARAWRTGSALWTSLSMVRAIDRARVPDGPMDALRPGPLRARALSAGVPRFGPRTDDLSHPPRLQQVAVYLLTTRVTDLAADGAGWLATRVKDAVRR